MNSPQAILALRRKALVMCLAMGACVLVWEQAHVPWSREGLPSLEGEYLLDINQATAGELAVLPSIGPKTAAAIVQERLSGGPFCSVADLGRVRGLGPHKQAQLAPWVEVK